MGHTGVMQLPHGEHAHHDRPLGGHTQIRLKRTQYFGTVAEDRLIEGIEIQLERLRLDNAPGLERENELGRGHFRLA